MAKTKSTNYYSTSVKQVSPGKTVKLDHFIFRSGIVTFYNNKKK